MAVGVHTVAPGPAMGSVSWMATMHWRAELKPLVWLTAPESLSGDLTT